MKRCSCGETVPWLALHAVCNACLRDYLSVLPERPGFSIADFERERCRQQQATAAQTPVVLPLQRVRLLDTPLDPVTLEDTLALVKRYAATKRPHQIVTLNVDLIKIAGENERFRSVVHAAELSIADGKPLLWAARWTGQMLPARITGTDLVLGAAKLAAERGESMFFLGAAEGVAAQAAAALQAIYPDLKITCYSPPMGAFANEENRRMVDMIRASGATYLFVALGSPRGQIWIDGHLDELDVPVCAEIGGVFNFLAGTVKRAPGWVQNCGMEWLYRIGQEPRRLWRRYVLGDMPVFVQMLRTSVAHSAVGVIHPTYQPQPAPVLAYEREAQIGGLEHAVGGS
jgi:N-acetylglucosaminyldiphosphoundecaprenol N-acetyl-beta-D-mannosaminyltransferase